MKNLTVHFRAGIIFLILCVGISNACYPQVSVTDKPSGITPQSLLHVHSNSASGQIFQLTNTTSGYTLPSHGFSIQLDPGFKTVFKNQYNNTAASISFMTNDGSDQERLTIRNNGNIGIGHTAPPFKLTVSGQLGLLETGAGPTYYSVLQSADLSGQLIFTLPAGYGTSGQVLTSNGLGAMSWSSAESPLTFLNGLSRIVSTVKWGGSLTENTSILQSGTQTLNFKDGGTANISFNLSGTGDLDFQDNGNSFLYLTDDAKVGFGTTAPASQVHITGNTEDAFFSKILFVENTSTSTTGQQIFALEAKVNHAADVNSGAAIHGYSASSIGNVSGIWGESAGEHGMGVYGRADHTTGINYGVYGQTLSASGYAGYFVGGRNFFQGPVGFMNDSPVHNVDILGDFYQDCGTRDDNGMYMTGNTGLALAYFRNLYPGNTWGLSAGCGSSSAGEYSYGVYGYNQGAGYGVWGISETGIGVQGKNYSSANYGSLGSADWGVYGAYGSNSYGYIGGYSYGAYGRYGSAGNYGYLGGYSYSVMGYNSNSMNYGYLGGESYPVFGSLQSNNLGNYSVYGEGLDASGINGTSYGVSYTIGGVRGYNYWGNPYTFGVAGYSYLDYARSGATFGSHYSGSGSYPWGCLAYKNSGSTNYGGYFTSYTNGSGKSSGVMINSGISAWGDLFGADIHGHVYGAFLEGEDYSVYANGDVFKNGLDVSLQKETNGDNVPLYTNVSTDVTVQTCGYATLSTGSCQVAFDRSFVSVVSEKSPVIVTITPMGNTGGVYLAEVSSQGFTAVENNNGKSSVMISYIAIGKRSGYEDPQLPQEVLSAYYLDKLKAGLHNDGDTQTNSTGLYYESGQLHNGVHPSTGVDPNKPAKNPHAEKVDIPSENPKAALPNTKDAGKGDGGGPQKGVRK